MTYASSIVAGVPNSGLEGVEDGAGRRNGVAGWPEVTCPWIVEEYREVARRAKFRRYGFPSLWLEFLIEESLHLPDPTTWQKRGPDPKDLPFLALAHVAGAWLVTGNLKHFPEAVPNDVRVLSPADYLAHLGEGQQPAAE